MHIRTSVGALGAVLALAAGSAGAAQRGARAPSASQIRAAVHKAERSHDLWATFNLCNRKSTTPPGYKLVGIRVQMPALGFTTRLYFSVRVEYRNASKRFVQTTAHDAQSIGLAGHRPRQGGVIFPFTPPPASAPFMLRAVARFEWRIGRKVLGRVVRNTGQGYQHVDFSNPPGYNAATCVVTA